MEDQVDQLKKQMVSKKAEIRSIFFFFFFFCDRDFIKELVIFTVTVISRV